MIQRVENLYKASTSLFLFLEYNFIECSALIVHKSKFYIFVAQLLCLVTSKPEGKQLQYESSVYVHKIIKFIAIFPTLQTINEITENTINYFFICFLTTIIFLIINVVYSNYKNYKRNQTIQLSYIDETMGSKICLQTIFTLWNYVILIPLTTVSINSIQLETDLNFNFLIAIISLILTFLITTYISVNLRKHQFQENIQIEDYSLLNVIKGMLIQLLAIIAYGNQFLVVQHIIFFCIIIINLYQGLLRFSFGYNSIQRIQIQLYITCLTFHLTYLIWYYSNMTDELLFFFYMLLLPFTFGISNNFYQDRMFEKLQGFIINFHDVQYANQALRYINTIYQDNVESSKLYYRSKQDIQTELLLNSLFYQHQKICSNTKCPVRLNRNCSTPITSSIIEKYIQYFYQTRINSLDLLKQDIQSYENIAITCLNYLIYKRNYLLAYKCCQQSNLLIESLRAQITDSYFFKAALQIVSNHCILQIYDKNLKLVTISQQQFQIQSDIINLLQIEDYYFQELYSQLIQYIKLFTEYQNQQFYSFEELLHQLNKLYQQNNQIIKNIHQNNQHNLNDIRQGSLYFLRIEFLVNIVTNNDYGYLLQLTQKLQKEELLLEENSKTFFNNNSFVGDQGISIIGNLLNGKLYNPQNKSINKFFKYDPMIQLTKSEELMPKDLGKIHQGLIDRYLITGKSTRINNLSETYIQNSGGFLERCQIFFSNYFSQSNKNDLLLIVFLKKITEATQNSGVILVSEDLKIYGITEELFYFIYGQPSAPNTPTEEYAFEARQFLKKLYQQDLEEIAPSCYDFINLNHQDLASPSNIKFNGFIMKYSPTKLGKSLKGFSSQNFHETQIQFQILKKVYLPYIEGIEKPTIGYEIHIEFDEISTGYTSQQRCKLFKVPLLTFRSLKKLNYSEKTPQQTNRITSEYNETNRIRKANYETDLDLSSVGNQQYQSVNKIIGQVCKFYQILDSKGLIKSLKYIIVKILVKCLFLITFIILFAFLNIQKNNAQTVCIYESNFDIEYLDSYSQLFFGSRRVMYNRDFYNATKDRIIEYNKSTLNISRYDQIIYSHGNLLVALGRLDEKEKDYTKMIQHEGSQDMKVTLLDSDFQIYYQEVHSRAEFNQVMYITFFWSYLTFAQSPNNYLKGSTDPFIIIFTRSQLMYNFFTMAQLSADKVAECLDLTFDFNNQIDEIAFMVFIFYYVLFILLQTIASLFFIQAYKDLKIYLKYFGLLNYYDLNLTIDYYEQIKDLLKVHQLCFSTHEFQKLVEKPQQQLHAIRLGTQLNSSSNKFPQNKIRKTLSYKKMILLIGLGFILIQFYGAFNQIYYQFQSQQITPIFLKAIQAEKIRLNYIIGMSYWDFYCVRKFYMSYNSTKTQDSFWSTNIEQNTKILSNLNVSHLKVIQELDDIKQSSISDLIISLEENSYIENEFNEHKLGYSDVCEITGCNLSELRDRPHFDNFISYFKQGVIQLEKIVNRIFTDHSQLIDPMIEDTEYLIRYQQLQEDLDFFIIYQFGVDAFQIEMQQFSKYFLYLSTMKLDEVKQLNLFFVVFTGLIILFFYLITSIFFLKKLIYTVRVARVSLKYIPIQIIFKKKIDYQLIQLERKNL